MKDSKTWMIAGWILLVVIGVFLGVSTLTPVKAANGTDGCPQQIEKMIDAHPYRQTVEPYKDELIVAIHETCKCSRTCVTCADACVGEKDPTLTVCIRLSTDCADVCNTTTRLLSRLTETPMEVMRSQLQTCIVACQSCGQECQKHAEKQGYCRICADSCLRCAQACSELLAAMR